MLVVGRSQKLSGHCMMVSILVCETVLELAFCCYNAVCHDLLPDGVLLCRLVFYMESSCRRSFRREGPGGLRPHHQAETAAKLHSLGAFWSASSMPAACQAFARHYLIFPISLQGYNTHWLPLCHPKLFFFASSFDCGGGLYGFVCKLPVCVLFTSFGGLPPRYKLFHLLFREVHPRGVSLARTSSFQRQTPTPFPTGHSKAGVVRVHGHPPNFKSSSVRLAASAFDAGCF